MIELPCGWKIEIEPLRMGDLELIDGLMREERMVWHDKDKGRVELHRKSSRYTVESKIVFHFISGIVGPDNFPFAFWPFNGRTAVKANYKEFAQWWFDLDVETGEQIIQAFYSFSAALKRLVDNAYKAPLQE